MPTIPNPSFEQNSFSVAPGLVAGNGGITGWNVSDVNRAGINPAGGVNFFADNGAVPNGTKVAFIQSAGAPATISTTITGLTAGVHYKVAFRSNRKTGPDAAGPSIRLNGGARQQFPVISPAGLPNSTTGTYGSQFALFTATGPTALMEITNSTVTDTTLLVDNFTITVATPIQVTNTNNDGPGSLRQTMATAAATTALNVITFAPALSGQTITLLGNLPVNDVSGLVIDASALPKGITIDGGPGANNVFTTFNLVQLSLRSLTITGGVGNGGAISCGGVVSATRCTLAGNGDATTTFGGAINNSGQVSLLQCTLTENFSNSNGGAIQNTVPGTVFLDHCTVALNTGNIGGGIINQGGTVTLINTIVADNTAPNGADIRNLDSGAGQGVVLRVGNTIIEDEDDVSGGESSGPVINADPLLDVLADNGGPTRTKLLLAGSPARNAAVGSTITTDQRGKPVQGSASDIGATEVQRGTFVFVGSAGIAEGFSTGVSVFRRDGFEGAATVKVTAGPGTASASDFTMTTNPTLTFADGVEGQSVNIQTTNEGVTEPNETVKLTLSAPSAGTSLGTPNTTTVTIVDSASLSPATDLVAPSAPVFTAPAANAVINAVGTISLTGTATDDKAVDRVQFRITGDPGSGIPPTTFADAIVDSPKAKTTTWSASFNAISPISTVLLEAQAVDAVGQVSPLGSRTIKLLHPLDVRISGNGSVSAGFAPRSFRQLGNSNTITATPVVGSIFAGWTVSGGPSLAQLGVVAVDLERPTLTFLHRKSLVLTANFVPSPFTPQAVGSYKGLVLSSTATHTNATEGVATISVTSTGGFSGNLVIDGLLLNFAGGFDPVGEARFGSSRARSLRLPRPGKSSLEILFEFAGSPPFSGANISGEVRELNLRNEPLVTSNFTVRRAAFDGVASIVPPNLLGAANANGVYNVILRAEPVASQPPGFDETFYPQGTGLATMTLTKAGVVTLTTGTLADGATGFTASTFLAADFTAPLFLQLYSKKGFLRTLLKFDTLNAQSDVAPVPATPPVWLRPPLTAQHYPQGWEETIAVGLLGAKYTVTPGVNAFPGQDGTPLDPPNTIGNVELFFSDGQLADTLNKHANLSSADVLTKVPANDSTYTATVTRTSGLVSGTFRHTDTNVIPFTGITFQKGTLAGAHGFFLTKAPVPIDFSGESGRFLMQFGD